MSKPSVIVVGSGAGGSVAAWALRSAGHPVLILEKGRNLLPGLGTRGPIGALFSNDEVKAGRYFENQDPILEPRTSRTQAESRRGVARSFVGDVNDLPTVVGGGTVHWDAKVPRFWRQDFKGHSLYGPVPDANVADWPLTYDELAPFYDEVEGRLGVQGDVHRMPSATLAQAPRRHQFAMLPNPPMYGGTLWLTAPAGWVITPIRSRWQSIRRPTTVVRPATRADSARASAARSTRVEALRSRSCTRRSCAAPSSALVAWSIAST